MFGSAYYSLSQQRVRVSMIDRRGVVQAAYVSEKTYSRYSLEHDLLNLRTEVQRLLDQIPPCSIGYTIRIDAIDA